MAKKGDAELNIRVKTSGGPELKALQAEVDKLKKKLEETGGKDGAGKANVGLSDLISTAAKVKIALAGVVYGTLELAKNAGKFDQVRRAFQSMAASQGQDADRMLANMKRATDGMVTNLDLMVNANKAMMLGLPIERFDELMGIAKSAAESTGQSMEYMLESIVLGIGRQSRLILDNLGIIVSAEDAYAKYAKEVGKSADALSEAEKKQAFMNEVLRVGKENAENAGEGTDNANKAWQRFTTRVKDAAVALGGDLAPAVSETLDLMTQVIDVTDKFAQGTTVQKWSLEFQKEFAHVSFAVQSLVRNLMSLVYVAGGLFQGSMFGNDAKGLKGMFEEVERRWKEMEAKRAELITETNQKLADIEDNLARRRVEMALAAGEEIAEGDRKVAAKVIKEKLAAEKKKNEQILAGEEATRLKREKADEAAGEKELTWAKKKKNELTDELIQLDKEYGRERQRLAENYNEEDTERLIQKLDRDLLEAKRVEVIRMEETLRLKKSLTNEEKELLRDLQTEANRINTEIADHEIKERKRVEKEKKDAFEKALANPLDPENLKTEEGQLGAAAGIANASVEGKAGAKKLIVEGEAAAINAITKTELGTALKPFLQGIMGKPEELAAAMSEFVAEVPVIFANQFANMLVMSFSASYWSRIAKAFIEGFTRVTNEDLRVEWDKNAEALRKNWAEIDKGWTTEAAPAIREAGDDLKKTVTEAPTKFVESFAEAARTLSTEWIGDVGAHWREQVQAGSLEWRNEVADIRAHWSGMTREWGYWANEAVLDFFDGVGEVVNDFGEAGQRFIDMIVQPLQGLGFDLRIASLDTRLAGLDTSINLREAGLSLWENIGVAGENFWNWATSAGETFWNWVRSATNMGGGDTGIRGGKGLGDAIGVDTTPIEGMGSDVPVSVPGLSLGTSQAMNFTGSGSSSGGSSSGRSAAAPAARAVAVAGSRQVVINLTVNGGMLGTAQEARAFARAIDREFVRMRRDNESLSFDKSL